MSPEDRRKEIALYLMTEKKPISGSLLSKKFNVSRQIIVQDITVLKSLGYDIISTHYGYVIQKNPYVERIVKVYHTKENTEDELSTIVNLGGMVVDVQIWHKAYGKITADLNIYNQNHIEKFMSNVRSGKSTELMNITGGYHYHTIRANDDATLKKIINELEKKNYLASGD